MNFKEALNISEYDEEYLEEATVKPIKGKVIPIKQSDYKRVFGGGKQPVKKTGYVIAKDGAGKLWYVPKPKKKGSKVEWNSEAKKFVSIFDREAARQKSITAKKVARQTAKKRARSLSRTAKLRR